MNLKKKIARNVLFPAAMKLGMDGLLRKMSRNSILNVMYHGVTPGDVTYFSPRHLLQRQFEEHLIYFKKNFDIISIPEAFYLINNRITPKRNTLTISFDDGYQNNLHVALPLLEKYRVTATFFIAGICAEDMPIRCLWPDLICALDLFTKNKIIEIGSLKFFNLKEIKTGEHMFDFFKKVNHTQRDGMLDKLILDFGLEEKLHQVPGEAWKLMTGNEIIQLAQSPRVSIGSHGHLHYNLANVELDFATQELVRSKSLLESLIGTEIFMVAYPDGSYNDDVKDAAERTGYRYQLAVSYKNQSDQNDPRILDRFGISCTTTFESNMIRVSRAFSTKGH